MLFILRAGFDVPDSVSYVDFYIGMSYYNSETDSMSLDCTPPVSWYSTDTMVYSAAYTIPGPIDSGDWVKIPLQTPFPYNPTKNFIIDISQSQGTNLPPFYGIHTFEVVPIITSCLGYIGAGSSFNTPTGVMGRKLIGFDMLPTDVKEVSAMSNFRLYPNPGDGRFTISFVTQKSAGDVRISVSSVTGQRVWEERFRMNGSSFRREVDLGDISAGVYFVEVLAAGERTTRKVVVQ